MKLVAKLWLGIGLVLVSALSLMAWFGHQHSRQNVEAALLEEGRSIQGVLMAMRRAYQRQFLASGLELDARTVGFLPAHAMTRIAQDFQAFDRRGMRFNNVSERARNPANQADADQMEAIRHFRAQPQARERLTAHVDAQGRRFYQYATPTWTEAYCLHCHGRPEDAPAAIRQRYDLAYGYREGELRGILSVRLPAAQAEARILGAWWREQAIHLGVAALALLLAGALMQRLVVRRLDAFGDGARRLAADDYAWRAPEHGADETAELARSLNEMAQPSSAARRACAWRPASSSTPTRPFSSPTPRGGLSMSTRPSPGSPAIPWRNWPASPPASSTPSATTPPSTPTCGARYARMATGWANGGSVA